MMDKHLEDNLKRIRELSDDPRTLPHIAHIHEELAEYDMTSGSCFGVGLFWIEGVAVQHSEMSEDSELKSHMHEGIKEILICYEGDLQIFTKVKDELVEAKITSGGIIVIPPDIPHIAKSIRGCKIIAVSIPASSGYPKTKTDTNGH